MNLTAARKAGSALSDAYAFDIDSVKERLAAGDGGYEIIHASPGLEIGVYVLVAPEPDRQQPYDGNKVYIVLAGRGVLEVEGEWVELHEGHAVFVPAGAEHRFVGYEQLSLLVILERRPAATPPAPRQWECRPVLRRDLRLLTRKGGERDPFQVTMAPESIQARPISPRPTLPGSGSPDHLPVIVDAARSVRT
jgi:mannose-6-phosphate isomerase-like protein (cupin superfamily)